MSDITPKPTVSVVIPAYNIEGYVSRAIESVLAQTRRPHEIIVVDDGSTDETAEIIKKFAPRVCCLHKENGGLSSARNAGIRAATGEWMAFLDGDDEWLDNCLEQFLVLIERNGDLEWCCGNFIRCLCNENRRAPDIPPDRARRLLGGKDYFDNYLYALRHGAGGNTNTMFIRRSMFDRTGYFDENCDFAEDLDMWWRITYRQPRIGYITEPIAVYHMVRPGTLTGTFRHSNIIMLTDLIERHLQLADQHNQATEFRRMAKRMAGLWIRALLFENRPGDIRNLTNRLGPLLSLRFKAAVRLLITFPRTTACLCHAVSRIVRSLQLRHRIVRRPL